MTLTITFGEPEDVTNPGMDAIQYSFPFAVIDSALVGSPEQKSATRHHRIIVTITRSRLAGWRLSADDLISALFELGKRHVAELAHSNSLPEENTIRLPTITTVSHPSECPFDPGAIPSPAGFTITVEQARRIGF